MTEYKYQWAAGAWNHLSDSWTIDMLFKGDEMLEARRWADDYKMDLLIRTEDGSWETVDD